MNYLLNTIDVFTDQPTFDLEVSLLATTPVTGYDLVSSVQPIARTVYSPFSDTLSNNLTGDLGAVLDNVALPVSGQQLLQRLTFESRSETILFSGSVAGAAPTFADISVPDVLVHVTVVPEPQLFVGVLCILAFVSSRLNRSQNGKT